MSTAALHQKQKVFIFEVCSRLVTANNKLIRAPWISSARVSYVCLLRVYKNLASTQKMGLWFPPLLYIAIGLGGKSICAAYTALTEALEN